MYHLSGQLTDEVPLGGKEANGECDIDRRYISFGSWGRIAKVKVPDWRYEAGFRYEPEFKPSKKLIELLNRVSDIIVWVTAFSSMFSADTFSDTRSICDRC